MWGESVVQACNPSSGEEEETDLELKVFLGYIVSSGHLGYMRPDQKATRKEEMLFLERSWHCGPQSAVAAQTWIEIVTIPKTRECSRPVRWLSW